MQQAPITLTRYIIEEQAAHPAASGEFSLVMAQIALAAKMISSDLSRAGLIDIQGGTGETNVQGEAVQKMDQRTNATFVRAFEYYGGLVRMLVSEEIDKPLRVGGLPSGDTNPGKYALFFDPLDGSSNVDVNAGQRVQFYAAALQADSTVSCTPENPSLEPDVLFNGNLVAGCDSAAAMLDFSKANGTSPAWRWTGGAARLTLPEGIGGN